MNIKIKSKGLFVIGNNSFDQPIVSVIVRTCGRPTVLNECLNSIQKQTFKDFEVCIAEDGRNISENFIKENFPSLKYKYIATGYKKGRSYTGNLALTMATGKYLTFLDDDDVMYENHLQTMVDAAISAPEQMLFYTKSYCTPIRINSIEPYNYELNDKIYIQQPVYTKSALIANNIFPIQTVLFKRELYDKYGGFDLSYEFLEDWELWLRYSQACDFTPVNSFTSEYRVPASNDASEYRNAMLKVNEEQIRLKYLTTKKVNIKEFNPLTTPLFKCKTDDCYMISENILYINGWGFHKEGKSNPEFYILITDKHNRKQLYTAESYVRKDVAQVYPESKNQRCGFASFININENDIKSVEIILKNGKNFFLHKRKPILKLIKKILHII